MNRVLPLNIEHKSSKILVSGILPSGGDPLKFSTISVCVFLRSGCYTDGSPGGPGASYPQLLDNIASPRNREYNDEVHYKLIKSKPPPD